MGMSTSLASLAAKVTESLDCPAIWDATRNAMRQEGLLSGDMRDMPKLIEFIEADFHTFNEDAVKERLYQIVWPSIKAILLCGLAKWYRASLEEDEVLHDIGEAGA